MSSAEPGTIGRLLCVSADRLRQAGVDNARHEARWLLAWHLGMSVSALLAARDAPVEAAEFEPVLARRLLREPLAFITGQQPFRALDLLVSPVTLIPRADSETLVEAVLDRWPDRLRPLRILDLGTGTGCLLLAVLAEYPAAFGVGVDLSPDAAMLAARNAIHVGCADRAVFLAANWADAIHSRFDVILSNPPYIPRADLAGLMPEVIQYEPLRALDGGSDGLDAYHALIGPVSVQLAAGGAMIMEIGIGQAEAVKNLAKSAGFDVQIFMDGANLPRALILSSTIS